jgi:hypothetical protein
MRLYVDDLRQTGARTALGPNDSWFRVYNAFDAIVTLAMGGITHVSLDYDLDAEGELDVGITGTGLDIAHWIANNRHVNPGMTWEIHSTNAAGRAAMESVLNQSP